MSNRIIYEIKEPSAQYTVVFTREQDVMAIDLGAASAYQRFLGGVTLERRAAGELIESACHDAIWELLYFGPRVAPATKP